MLRNFSPIRSAIWARLFLLVTVATLVFWACQLTQSGATNYSLSFDAQYDSLSKFDSVVIEVKDAGDGAVTDTVFKGAPDSRAKLENLSAPHFHGGKAIIIITAFNGGKLGLKLNKQYDGASGKTESTDSIILPNTALTPDSTALHLKLGDTANLPKVTVTPSNLKDPSLAWSSSDVGILLVNGTHIIAKGAGVATLTAKLAVNPVITAAITVTIADTASKAKVPDAPSVGSLNAGDAKVTVSWTVAAGIDSYNLYYGEGGSVDKGSNRIKNVTTPYDVKGLKNGTAYGFALTAVNSAGESDLGPVKTGTPEMPSPTAPIIDTVSSGNGSVTLTWKAVPGAIGYVLYYKAGQTVDKTGTRVTEISSPYVLSGLANGTQYAFVLTSLMSDAESGVSNVATATPMAPAAGSLSYKDNPAIYWKSVSIAPNAPSFSGTVDSFTVTPALPPGLSLNAVTGIITGTPTAATAKADYTIKAKNSGGEASAVVSIVVYGPPSGLSYSENPGAYWQAVPIATNSATVNGVVDSFTVAPSLPAGLSLSKTTGAISGTPSSIAATAIYTVTAWNASGTATAGLTLGVSGPPSGFSYVSNPAVYWQNVAISPNTATVTGSVDSFTVTPALPAGLSLNKTNGAITGKPTAASASTAYTITARNAAGSPTVSLNITVNGPPTAFSYAFPTPTYWQNVAISQNSATITGTVDSFTVTPALPAGLSLNKATGAITGTPSATAASASYVITAKNDAGSITATVAITVFGAPSGFTYSTNPATYPKSAAIVANMATVTGPVDSFTVTPALPAGLTLNKFKGDITGTPTTAAAAAIFVVTARNGAGSVSANLSIAIASPLSGFTYAVNPAVYWKSVAISANAATITGTPDSFTVSPALPAGLSLNKATGAITGTPTAAAASAVYVVTAKTLSSTLPVNVTIAVNGPPTLAYAPASQSWTKSTQISTLTPTTTGIIDSITVTPALPSGISLNASSGALSGTPTAVSSATSYVFTAWNKAGTAKDTMSISVLSSSTVTLSVIKDLVIDTTNSGSYNTGFSPAGFFGRLPGTYQFPLFQFDLTGVSTTGLTSAKVVFKTYAYGPSWNGSPVTLKAHIIKLKHTWTEGTGNWYWNAGAWQNSGEPLLTNYPFTDSIKTYSTNPATVSGTTFLDHYLVRSDSIVDMGTQDITMTWPLASIHTSFSNPIPGPANLIPMEFDVTNYVKAAAGAGPDYGFSIFVENLPTTSDFVGFMMKEAGDMTNGAKLNLTY